MILKAYQLADNIDLVNLRNNYSEKPYSYTGSEIFYTNNTKYIYVLSYGVVVFGGYNNQEIAAKLKFIEEYLINPISDILTEEFQIHENSDIDKFQHNEVYLSKISPEIIKIVMLNIGQSVALDLYRKQAKQMLLETNYYTKKLEKAGRLFLSGKKLLRFIGKTLNVKNKIVNHLYVIGQPQATWDDAYLSKINLGLRQTFEIEVRFQSIDYSLKNIKENLDLFKDLMHHRQASLLEIIIILLILIEVIDVFIGKLF